MIEAGQQVNRIGKYLKKHIDGAYKIAFRPNECDVYMFMYYQIPGQAESLKTMNFLINITTYQKKVRVNVIEMTDFEKTIGHDVYKPDELDNLPEACKKIYDKVCHKIEREYSDYEFIF